MNESLNGLSAEIPQSNNLIKLVIGWSIVGAPSLWAVWQVVVKSAVLFQ